MAWLRLILIGAVALSLAPGVARAQSAAQQAEVLNDQGKQLFAAARKAKRKADKLAGYQEALRQFRAATVLSPEARFYFNVCYTLGFLGRYQRAVAACEQALRSGPDAALREKIENGLVSLRRQAARGGRRAKSPDAPTTAAGTGDAGGGTGATPVPGGTTADPTGAGATSSTTPPAGDEATDQAEAATARPTEDPFGEGAAGGAAAASAEGYTWSIGLELGGASNGGLGSRDGDELFASGGGELRLVATAIVSPKRQIGLAGYLGATHFGPAERNPAEDQLSVVDLGVGAFLERPLSGKLHWAPLLGVHASVLKPSSVDQGFLAVGARVEVALAYVFGAHAIRLVPGLDVYSAAGGSSNGVEPADFYLDQGSAVVTVGIGYQFRFASPLGATPLITLE